MLDYYQTAFPEMAEPVSVAEWFCDKHNALYFIQIQFLWRPTNYTVRQWK